MAKLRDELVQRLAPLGVEHRPMPGRDDGFASLFYRDRPFAHFHNDNELDIHLTREIIQREGLTHPVDSTVHPGRSSRSLWIEFRFATRRQLDRIVEVIKLLIQHL